MGRLLPTVLIADLFIRRIGNRSSRCTGKQRHAVFYDTRSVGSEYLTLLGALSLPLNRFYLEIELFGAADDGERNLDTDFLFGQHLLKIIYILNYLVIE